MFENEMMDKLQLGIRAIKVLLCEFKQEFLFFDNITKNWIQTGIYLITLPRKNWSWKHIIFFIPIENIKNSEKSLPIILPSWAMPPPVSIFDMPG